MKSAKYFTQKNAGDLHSMLVWAVGRKILSRTRALITVSFFVYNKPKPNLRTALITNNSTENNYHLTRTKHNRTTAQLFFIGIHLLLVTKKRGQSSFPKVNIARLRQECHNSKIWHFWVIGIERNVCRCTFNRYSVITQFVKLATGKQSCRCCTHRKLWHFKPFKRFSWKITHFELWHCCRKWEIWCCGVLRWHYVYTRFR